MLKLISLNIEEDKHYDLVLGFLHREQPEVVCLQEVPETFLPMLIEQGYICSFAPMFTSKYIAEKTLIGVAIVSKIPFVKTVNYYYQNQPAIRQNEMHKYIIGKSYACLGAHFTLHGVKYDIFTTHLPVTPHGKADEEQIIATEKMLALLAEKDSHIICGDFNIPRNINHLYKNITKKYTDEIPLQYKSSLDQNLHRLGNQTLDDPIFEKYMVDYIFTQSPYKATDVRLEFGVSDHSAVVAIISKED